MIEVFWGDEPGEQSERDFLAQLKDDLSSRNVSATILANFHTYRASRQVDFLVIRRTMSARSWSTRLPDGTLEVIDRQNPYNQAVLCKMAISDDLHVLAGQDSGIPRPPKGARFYTQLDSVVCVFPRLEAGSRVPGNYKARTLGYAEFVDFLTALG